MAWGCTVVTDWQMLCGLLRSLPLGPASLPPNKAVRTGGWRGARLSQQEQGKAHPSSQSSAEGVRLAPWPRPRAQEQSQLVSLGSGRLSIYIVPSPRPHSPSGPQTPRSIRAGPAWTPAQGHPGGPAPTVAFSLWSRPQPWGPGHSLLADIGVNVQQGAAHQVASCGAEDGRGVEGGWKGAEPSGPPAPSAYLREAPCIAALHPSPGGDPS